MLGVISDHTNMILLHLQLNASLVNIRILKTYVKGWHKRDNQKLSNEGQTMQWSKENNNKDKKFNHKTIHQKTKEWNGDERKWSKVLRKGRQFEPH